jgi:hypothetical protein
MLEHANSATVDWDAKDKQWHVRINVGAEVIKRPLPKNPQDAAEDTLRAAAVATAQSEGYEVNPSTVTIAR